MSSEVKKSGKPVPEGVVELWKEGGEIMGASRDPVRAKPLAEAILFLNLKEKLCHFELQPIGTQWRKTSGGNHFSCKKVLKCAIRTIAFKSE